MDRIFIIWFGKKMSDDRKKCLDSIYKNIGCEITLITEDNLKDFVKVPLHKAFPYLSKTHKADYLRTYLMHHYGGGYTDIKFVEKSWDKYFELLKDENTWIVGYKLQKIESRIYPGDGDIGRKLKKRWKELLGVSAFICKKNTPFTNEWINNLHTELDKQYVSLVQASLSGLKRPQKWLDKNGINFSEEIDLTKKIHYPLRYFQILADIFYPLVLKYNENINRDLPEANFVVKYR
jgi:hypothetical protein